jgi:hypothetical protein
MSTFTIKKFRGSIVLPDGKWVHPVDFCHRMGNCGFDPKVVFKLLFSMKEEGQWVLTLNPQQVQILSV